MEPSLPQSSLDIEDVCPTARPDVRLLARGVEFADRRSSTPRRHADGRIVERLRHPYQRGLNFEKQPRKMSVCC